MITELRQPLHMQTPKGPGRALFVIDTGSESNLEWVVFLDADGSCWVVPNPEVRLFWNWTAGRRPSATGDAPPKRNSRASLAVEETCALCERTFRRGVLYEQCDNRDHERCLFATVGHGSGPSKI